MITCRWPCWRFGDWVVLPGDYSMISLTHHFEVLFGKIRKENSNNFMPKMSIPLFNAALWPYGVINKYIKEKKNGQFCCYSTSIMIWPHQRGFSEKTIYRQLVPVLCLCVSPKMAENRRDGTKRLLMDLIKLTLVLLNILRCHTHFQFTANQITWSGLLL